MDDFKKILSNRELLTLSSIVQVGDATYRDLMENQQPMFGHRYFDDTRGRIRTKLVQMQCEIESHDYKFPFQFQEKKLGYGQVVPELHTENVVLHIGRSASQHSLPYASKYKRELSCNNEPLSRQMKLGICNLRDYTHDPYYGILVFGGQKETFSVIHFPAPGYKSIAETIYIPEVKLMNHDEEVEKFERKKAVLKKEFLAHGIEEAIS